ncbi:hypothetical protein PIB30_056367 [Stylosanthes scabra]|uniref:Histidine decarboxylase n=1 Tax=Stylosanthes scabra TaxID=79078 RepID=A0ABU6RJP3_9FABA|nr:hypothetical protein [Stylosanthes scabra]
MASLPPSLPPHDATTNPFLLRSISSNNNNNNNNNKNNDAMLSKGEEEEENNNGRHMNLAIPHSTEEPEPHANSCAVINQYIHTLNQFNLRNFGYPFNQNLKYDALAPLLGFHINNLGDPFLGSSFCLDSTSFEVSVLDWFANLWEIQKNKYWGYVTTGGTECNLHGILVGREKFPDGILYASEDSHYSIFKIARMYRMQCVKVGTLVSGEIDCADLKASLLAHKDKPAIINLNIGTTMKGAIDDIDLVIETLEKNGFNRDRFYIHCDVALFGIMLPFVKQKIKVEDKSVNVEFELGGPWMAQKEEWVGCVGLLIIGLRLKLVAHWGSRSGHAPIFLCHAITSRRGLLGFQKEAENCTMNASYLHNRLREARIGAMLNDFSNTVVFEKPLDDGFSRRWSLACKGNIAHVVVMQHVTIEMLNSFVAEFIQKRCFWWFKKDYGSCFQPPCIAEDVGVANCCCSMHGLSSSIRD